MAKSTVYFTKEITPEAVLKMYRQLGVELPGKVAVKVHSGEDGNQNFLRPEFMEAHDRGRPRHRGRVQHRLRRRPRTRPPEATGQLLKKHGWSKLLRR